MNGRSKYGIGCAFGTNSFLSLLISSSSASCKRKRSRKIWFYQNQLKQKQYSDIEYITLPCVVSLFPFCIAQLSSASRQPINNTFTLFNMERLSGTMQDCYRLDNLGYSTELDTIRLFSFCLNTASLRIVRKKLYPK